jgi:hypothetical protein
MAAEAKRMFQSIARVGDDLAGNPA